jgi:AraC-like DNA-binding protein
MLQGKYFGSIGSIKWKNIFSSELKKNKHLFSCKILSYHNTRRDALIEELRLHIKNNVIESKEYMNEAFAVPNGCFGRIERHSEKTKEKMRKSALGRKMSDNQKKKLSEFRSGKKYEELMGFEAAQIVKAKISERVSGENNYFFGKKWMLGKKGINCPNFGLKRSNEFKERISRNLSGKNHYRFMDIKFNDLSKLILDGISIKDISKNLNITEKGVYRKFKKHFGINPKEYKEKYGK